MEKTQANRPQIFNEKDALQKAQSGDEQACQQILLEYTSMVRARAEYYAQKYELDDFVQEGLFALYSAIQDYNFSTAFSTFARVCVDHRLMDVAKRRDLKKAVPQEKIVSLSDLILISAPEHTPEEQLLSKEKQELFWKQAKSALSEFEYSVLGVYALCGSINQTADVLGKEVKAVNNALFRMRTKLKKLNMPK